jgi:hypothetical protein
MVRDNAFDAGELAINTYLQAKAYGKPYAMLPAPVWAASSTTASASTRSSAT